MYLLDVCKLFRLVSIVLINQMLANSPFVKSLELHIKDKIRIEGLGILTIYFSFRKEYTIDCMSIR